MKWEPIETAPKDGTSVLLHIPYKVVKNGNRNHLKKPWNTIGFWVSDIDEEMSEKRHDLYMKHGGYWSNHYRGRQPLNGMPSHWAEIINPTHTEDMDDTL